jgi:hypothetical protein
MIYLKNNKALLSFMFYINDILYVIKTFLEFRMAKNYL